MKKIKLSGIVGWEITASKISKDLEEANGADIEVLISSPGGYVSEALEIFNLFRNYTGKVTFILSGFSMSAAAYIPLSGDKVIVEDNAVYMIHNVSGGVWGDHNEILHYGEMCKGLSGLLARAFVKFTGKTAEEIATMMDEETFFYGSDIVDAGFAHELAVTDDDEDQEGKTASARLAFQEVTAKLSADQDAIKKDLNRASALALGEINRAIEPTNPKEVTTMTLQELKKKYPDLVALIIDEATAGKEDSVTNARLEGATAERDRIQAVQAQSYPGHEDIVNAAMFDGKSQPGGVAMQINAANIKAEKKAAVDLKDDAFKPVVDPLNNSLTSVSKGPLTEEKAKANWDKNVKNCKNEFMCFEDFFAYAKNDSRFNVQINHGGAK